jgi:hypothetical protein
VKAGSGSGSTSFGYQPHFRGRCTISISVQPEPTTTKTSVSAAQSGDVTREMLDARSPDKKDLFRVVFHEATPAGYYGQPSYGTDGVRNCAPLEDILLEKEARLLASSIINYNGRQNISQTVWGPGYINRGGPHRFLPYNPGATGGR